MGQLWTQWTLTVPLSHLPDTLPNKFYKYITIFYKKSAISSSGYSEDPSTVTTREVLNENLMSVNDFQSRSEHVSDDSNQLGVMPTKFCSGNVCCNNHRNENKQQSPECKEFVIIGRWLTLIKQKLDAISIGSNSMTIYDIRSS